MRISILILHLVVVGILRAVVVYAKLALVAHLWWCNTFIWATMRDF
jgi:hypothetical protein